MATTHALIATLESLVDRLADLPPTQAPLLTLYLDGRPGPQGRDQVHPFLTKELRSRRRGLPTHADKTSYDADVERIQKWVRDELPASANGAAVFACSAAGIFEAAAFDPPIEGHQLHVGRRPHIYPLMQILDRYRRYAAVLADSASTRIYVFGLNTRLAARQVEGVRMHGIEGLDSSEHRYQRHADEHRRQHIREVAHILDRMVAAERIDIVMLAGDEEVLPLLRDALPKSVLAKVVDVVHLDSRTPEHEVLSATLEALRRHDARTDAEKVQRLLDEYRAGALGVVGVPATRLALTMGQVDELLLSSAAALTVDDEDLAEKTAEEREDLRTVTAEELATQARQTGAKVTFIEDVSLLKDVGGVGALLRFRIVPNPPPA